MFFNKKIISSTHQNVEMGGYQHAGDGQGQKSYVKLPPSSILSRKGPRV